MFFYGTFNQVFGAGWGIVFLNCFFIKKIKINRVLPPIHYTNPQDQDATFWYFLF